MSRPEKKPERKLLPPGKENPNPRFAVRIIGSSQDFLAAIDQNVRSLLGIGFYDEPVEFIEMYLHPGPVEFRIVTTVSLDFGHPRLDFGGALKEVQRRFPSRVTDDGLLFINASGQEFRIVDAPGGKGIQVIMEGPTNPHIDERISDLAEFLEYLVNQVTAHYHGEKASSRGEFVISPTITSRSTDNDSDSRFRRPENKVEDMATEVVISHMAPKFLDWIKAGDQFEILMEDDLELPLKYAIGWIEPGIGDFQAFVDLDLNGMDPSGGTQEKLIGKLAEKFDLRWVSNAPYPVFDVTSNVSFVLITTQTGFRISTGAVEDENFPEPLLAPPAATREKLALELFCLKLFLEQAIENIYLNAGRTAPRKTYLIEPIRQYSSKPKNSTDQDLRASVQEPEMIAVKKPVSFDSIGGNEELKAELKILAEGIRNPRIYRDWGSEPPNGILLYGPPGTGKSLAAHALANESGVTFVSISANDILDMWLGNAEKNMAKVFDDADKRPGRTILFIDEIEALFHTRETMTHESRGSVQAILFERTSGPKASGKVTLIGATNFTRNLDAALISRFDVRIPVPLPDAAARREIFAIHLKEKEEMAGRVLFGKLKWPEIIAKSEGLSGRDIKHIIANLTRARVRQQATTGKAKPTISHKELLAAVESYTPKEEVAPKRTIGFHGAREDADAKRKSAPKTR